MGEGAELSIVIPNWNGRALLPDCLDSTKRTTSDLRLEIIVVDNASSDGSVEWLRQAHPDVRVVVNARNEGFARACNAGVRASTAPFAVLLNTDTIVQPGAFQRLLDLARRQPRLAIAGAQLRNADGSFQSSHLPFPSLFLDWMIISGVGRLLHGASYPSGGPEDEKGPQRTEWVGGAAFLVRRTAFDQVSGLDEGYFMYAEEMDFCYRLDRAGWQIWYEPAARVIHLGGGSAASRGAREATLYRGRLRFYRLHHGAAAAGVLRWMILGFAAVKIAVHRILRLASGGRVGRQVVPLRQLRAELRQT